MQTFISRILEANGLTTLKAPLWKLKICDADFDELKKSLKNYLLSYPILSEFRRRAENNYNIRLEYKEFCLEATLFYAEWYKRIYTQSKRRGGVAKQDVIDALGSHYDDEEFYQAAKKGAESISGFEIVSLSNDRYLYSLLYQGGLPMHSACSEDYSDAWDKFLRGLVLRDYDFSIIPNKTAELSKSLIEFCDQIKKADDEGHDFSQMPFCCKDKNESGWEWYVYITEKIREKRNQILREHPFNVKWEFEVDEIGRRLNAYYIVTGPQSLSKEFLKSIDRCGESNHDISINIDSKKVFGDTYRNNFLIGRKFFFRAPYLNDTNISVFIEGHSTPIESDSLDIQIPHIMYRDAAGKYLLGNRMGSEETYIIYSQDWDVDGDDENKVLNLSYGNMPFRVMTIPSDISVPVVLKNKQTGDTIKFEVNGSLFWTEVFYQENELDYVFQESVYSPATTRFYKISDTTPHERIQNSSLLFREKYSQEWKEDMSIGCLYVRPKQEIFLSPVRIFNLGYGFKPEINSGSSQFTIKFNWPYGRVLPECGNKDENGIWTITKEDCQGKQLIPCTFTPTNNPAHAFTLHLKAQFTDFTISDINCNAIADGDSIPVCEVNLYSYSFKCTTGRDDQIKMTLPKSRSSFSITHYGNKLSVTGNEGEKWDIPITGSIDKLFGGQERLANELSASSGTVAVSLSGIDFGKTDGLSFIITGRPYDTVKDDEANVIRIEEHNANGRTTYTGDLFAFPLDDSKGEHVVLRRNENGEYPLPDSMPEKYIICENNYSSTSGRLKIRMHSSAKDEDLDRKALSHEAQKLILTQLKSDCFNSERWQKVMYWFNQSYEYKIPPGKLHDLSMCSTSDEFLVFLAFHAFILCTKLKRTDIIDRLLYLEHGLSFRWWAINPDLFTISAQKVNSPSFIDILYDWAIADSIKNNDIERFKILSSVNKDDFFPTPGMDFFELATKEFRIFMIRLSIRSLCGSTIEEEYLTGHLDRNLAELVANKCNKGSMISRIIMNAILNLDPKTVTEEIEARKEGKAFQNNIFSLVATEIPDDPMLGFNSNLVSLVGSRNTEDTTLEDTLFPSELSEKAFDERYGNYSKRFARRVKIVSDYLLGKSNYLFFDAQSIEVNDSIIHNIEMLLKRRYSIFFYYDRIRVIFLQHLEYMLSR